MKISTFLSVFLASAAVVAAETASAPAVHTEDFSKTLWSHWHGPKVKAKYTLDKNEGAAAKGAGKITITGKGSACFLKRLPVEPSSIYLVEVMVKSADKNMLATIQAQDFGLESKFVRIIGKNSTIATPEWQKFTYFFRTGKNTKTVQMLLDCFTADGGSMLYDDFKMSKVDHLEEYFDTFASNNWGKWQNTPKGAKLQFGHDKVEGRKTPGALKIDVLPGHNPKASGCATTTLPIVPGKTYTMVVYAKAKDLDPNATLSLSYQAQDEKYKFLSLPIPSRAFKASECADWKQIVITRKIIPTGRWEKCRNILVTLSVSGSSKGSALFDDFEFFVDENDEE